MKKNELGLYSLPASFSKKEKAFVFSELSKLSSTNICFKSQKFFKNHFLKNLPNKIQVRYFKTVRNINAENVRNPTLNARLRKWIGLDSSSVSSKIIYPLLYSYN